MSCLKSVLSEEDVRMYIRAGEIAKRVREEAVRYAKPGMKLLDLAEFIENRIRELGGEPAFPANLSINSIAAHYTPVLDDDSVILEDSVLKIDIGVHVDGYIADTAATVSFSPVYEPLIEASRNALERVIEVLRPGIKASEIGRVIEETIKSYGFKPIRNLSGHSIDRYMIHSGYSIPNYGDRWVRWSLSEGVYAIEPFATNGVGLVREDIVATIFSIKSIKQRLSIREKKVVDYIWRSRRSLPFCERRLKNLVGSVEGIRSILRILINKGVLHVYPVLIEKGNGIVSQFEHTIVIYGRDVIVTTK